MKCKEFIEDEKNAIGKAFEDSIKKNKVFDIVSWKKRREKDRIKYKNECIK